MEVSPLTQQARPTFFQSKISQLYDELLQDDEESVQSDGFWCEFLTLKPDVEGLQQRLDGLLPSDLVSIQHSTQQLFRQVVANVKSMQDPLSEHALVTLTVFLGCVLSKKYLNPSSDIINVLTGFDEVDAVFSEFVEVIDRAIGIGSSDVKESSIDSATVLTAGAWQTSLVSYFMQRDLFPGLVSCITTFPPENHPAKPFALLGLLANYNKFEFRNPYTLRLADYSNTQNIQQIIQVIGDTCIKLRDEYVTLQDDAPAAWSIGSTLSYVGLGRVAPGRTAPVTGAEEVQESFEKLPSDQILIFLTLYDFTYANPLFAHLLITVLAKPIPSPQHLKSSRTKPSATSITAPTPFSSVLSLTSYMLHHAHRSARTTNYCILSLLTLRLLTESSQLCPLLCSAQKDGQISTRLCRQRAPFLSDHPINKLRVPAEVILDICLDGINHNLRLRLDVGLYMAMLYPIHRIISHLARTKTKTLAHYHWGSLWTSLLSLLRFSSTYASTLHLQNTNKSLKEMLDPLLATLALAVTRGEDFLHTAANYDDLIYKLVQVGPTIFVTLEKAYDPKTRSLIILLALTNHYHSLLPNTAPTSTITATHTNAADLADPSSSPPPPPPPPVPPKSLSASQVLKVIRTGYDTLTLPYADGLDQWHAWRETETSGNKALMKKIGRVAVEDGKTLGLGRR